MLKIKNPLCLISVCLYCLISFSCHRKTVIKSSYDYYVCSFCVEDLELDYHKYKMLNKLEDTLENFSYNDIEHIVMGQSDSGHGDVNHNIKIKYVNQKIGISGYVGRYEPSDTLRSKIKEVIRTIPIQLLQLNRPPDERHRKYLDELSSKGKYQGYYEKVPHRYQEMRPITNSHEPSLYLEMMLKNGKSICYGFSNDSGIQPWYAKQWCEALNVVVAITYKGLNKGGFYISVWNEKHLSIEHRDDLSLDTTNTQLSYCDWFGIEDKFSKFIFFVDLNTGENTITDLKINGKARKDYIQKGIFRRFYYYKINRKIKGKVAEKMIIEYKINGRGYTKTINFDYQIYKAEKKD
jgi:hypothetical protein